MWTVTIHKRVEKRLALLTKDERDRILRAIHALRATPFEHDLKPLRGSSALALACRGLAGFASN
jgi:mRNA-degrading endonuclease RelE of RelBE toxin-antitoxin system